MANEMARKDGGAPAFSGALMESLDRAGGALPAGFNKERFVQNALALMNDSAPLRDYVGKHGAAPVIAGLMKGAYLGLDFYSRECYLIPYGDQLSYQTDYRGEVKLAKKHSVRPVREIFAEVVREGDEFRREFSGGEQRVTFRPEPFGDGAVRGAFAACLFEDGGMLSEAMSVAELENTRRQSKSPNSPAWKNFTTEMYRKTVLRRLCKRIELDFDGPEQARAYESAQDSYAAREGAAMAEEVAAYANSEDFEEEELPGFMAGGE